MQLPSLHHITRQTTSTLKRFPLTLLSALIAVAISIYLVEHSVDEMSSLFNIILVAILGISFFTVTKLIGEKRSWSISVHIATHTAAAVLLFFYYFSLPADLNTAPYLHVYRYMLYFLGLHLLVAIGPYWQSGQTLAFWQYNKTLFLRFLTAVLFSGVLFAGLAVALLSIDVLLNISIDEERYVQLFFLIGGLFNTWFFLAGIPASMERFEGSGPYPKGLKIFTQNILIPLVVIYLFILYLYAGKIILQWAWPEGWVANLILSFSIAGIFALLLLFPIQDKVENRWIRRFSTGYFSALVPLIVLLMLAIYRRIWEYGITIERYFVIILGLWLAGIVVYFLMSKSKSIKVIPASLCILVFLVSAGPWGAFSISERSQINRLEKQLKTTEILSGETIVKTSNTISFADRKNISNIIHYLHDNHGLEEIQPWFEQDFSQLTTTGGAADTTRAVNYHNRPQHIIELMGIDYVNRWETQPNQSARMEFYTDRNTALEVSSVKWIAQDLYWSPPKTDKRNAGANQVLFIESNSKNPHLRIYLNGNKERAVTINLKEVIDNLSEKFNNDSQKLPAEQMTFQFSTDALAATIYFSRINWSTQEDSLTIEMINFDLGLE